GDHVDVDAALTQRLEQGRRDTRGGLHARTDQGDLADVGVVADLGVADGLLRLLDRVKGGGGVVLRHGQRDRHRVIDRRGVLHDHVDVRARGGDHVEQQRRLAGDVRHLHDGDLAFAAVMRDARDDRRLQARVGLFHGQLLARVGGVATGDVRGANGAGRIDGDLALEIVGHDRAHAPRARAANMQRPAVPEYELRTCSGTPYRRAYSTLRAIRILEPLAARSSISSLEISGTRRADGATRGSAENTPSTSE